MKEFIEKIKTKANKFIEKIKIEAEEILEKIQLNGSQYVKITVAVVAVLVVGVILVVALTQDKDQYPDTGEGYSTPVWEETTTTPTVTEDTTPAETTNDQFDDSNIGQWLPAN